MSDSRSFSVTINLCMQSDGWVHWFVQSQEQLETVVWADDGTAIGAYDAAVRALDVARTELSHLIKGGHISI